MADDRVLIFAECLAALFPEDDPPKVRNLRVVMPRDGVRVCVAVVPRPEADETEAIFATLVFEDGVWHEREGVSHTLAAPGDASVSSFEIAAGETAVLATFTELADDDSHTATTLLRVDAEGGLTTVFETDHDAVIPKVVTRLETTTGGFHDLQVVATPRDPGWHATEEWIFRWDGVRYQEASWRVIE